MTPNMGQGANTAIETAACLSNALRALILAKHPEKPSEREIQDLLSRFNRTRLERLGTIHRDSWVLTRLESADGFAFRLLGRYVVQFLGDFFARGVARTVTTDVCLDYIPLTIRSGRDWPPIAVTEVSVPRMLGMVVIVVTAVAAILAAWLLRSTD